MPTTIETEHFILVDANQHATIRLRAQISAPYDGGIFHMRNILKRYAEHGCSSIKIFVRLVKQNSTTKVVSAHTIYNIQFIIYGDDEAHFHNLNQSDYVRENEHKCRIPDKFLSQPLQMYLFGALNNYPRVAKLVQEQSEIHNISDRFSTTKNTYKVDSILKLMNEVYATQYISSLCGICMTTDDKENNNTKDGKENNNLSFFVKRTPLVDLPIKEDTTIDIEGIKLITEDGVEVSPDEWTKIKKEVKVEQVQEVKVEQVQQEVKVEQVQAVKVEQVQEVKVEQVQAVKVEQVQEVKVEQVQQEEERSWINIGIKIFYYVICILSCGLVPLIVGLVRLLYNCCKTNDGLVEET